MESTISAAINSASNLFLEWLQESAPEHGRRLAALEGFVHLLGKKFVAGLWQLAGDELDWQAEAEAGICACGRKCQRSETTVAVSMLGQQVEFHCTYFYCKTCHVGDSPMRRWLGIHEGEVSLGLERAVTHLTVKETFGEAARQLEEQHSQEFDRTKLERITYVGGRG